MDNKKRKYLWTAVDIVIDYTSEQGLKYRRGDFSEQWSDGINHLLLHEDMVIILLCYSFERCGKRLKNIKDKFYNYINARVTNEGVQFSFSLKEIDLLLLKKNDPGSEGFSIDKIISKINKLLALADLERNPSEGEAIAASMKAQELLAKYNLDITDITGEEKMEEIEQVIADVGKGNRWKHKLAAVVARSYCCRVYHIGAEQVVFYGYRSDTLIARRVFVYLFTVGNRLASSYVKERREKTLGSTKGIYNSFCKGYVNGIDNELSRNCKALMLSVPSKINDSFDVFAENFKRVDTNIESIDSDAYAEGCIEGKRALNAQYIEGGGQDD